MNHLNSEQQIALQEVLTGKSVFITGQGGVGKSFLIGKIYDAFKTVNRVLAITAMTGCAALLLKHSAKTLHSWAGVGLGKDPIVKTVIMIRRNKNLVKRWRETDALIIDEISMMSPELFEKLDEIGRIIRMKHEQPFGGIQIIAVGDFFQLPPINKEIEEIRFVFESPIWDKTIKTTVELTKIIRQSDPVFQELLAEIREGRLSPEHLAILESRRGLPWKDQLIRPSLLFSRRADVEYINTENLKALKGPRRIYETTTEFSGAAVKQGMTVNNMIVQKAVEKLDRDAPYQITLVLSEGAQVMLVTNLDLEEDLANGSRGVVTGFGPAPTYIPNVLFAGKTLAIPVNSAVWEAEEPAGIIRRQIPLVLAYAITIHRSQGASLDSALIDIGISAFEFGQVYVALSRVKSLEALYIHDIDPTAIKAHPKVIAFYEKLREYSTVIPSTVIPSTVIPSTVIPSTVIPSIVIPSTVIPSTVIPSECSEDPV